MYVYCLYVCIHIRDCMHTVSFALELLCSSAIGNGMKRKGFIKRGQLGWENTLQYTSISAICLCLVLPLGAQAGLRVEDIQNSSASITCTGKESLETHRHLLNNKHSMYQDAHLIENKRISHFTNTLVQHTHTHSLKDKAMAAFLQGGCESHSHPVEVLASDRYVPSVSWGARTDWVAGMEKKERGSKCSGWESKWKKESTQTKRIRMHCSNKQKLVGCGLDVD